MWWDILVSSFLWRERKLANKVLARARKAIYPSQRDFGMAVAERLQSALPPAQHREISVSYAQKKASLWESAQLIPTRGELVAMSDLLKLPLRELEESFSTGVLPSAVADLLRALALSSGEGLVAICVAGRVRAKLFPEDEEALMDALNHKVSLAIFFPFPLDSATTGEYAAALTHQHREVWRTVVKFWKMLRSITKEPLRTQRIRLYQPGVASANMLFPPMFHRPTLLCERVAGRTTVDLYSWTQGTENDGFYRIGGRSIEDTDVQAEAWELYFGGVYEQWNETGELPDGDSYWQAYTGQTEPETD